MQTIVSFPILLLVTPTPLISPKSPSQFPFRKEQSSERHKHNKKINTIRQGKTPHTNNVQGDPRG